MKRKADTLELTAREPVKDRARGESSKKRRKVREGERPSEDVTETSKKARKAEKKRIKAERLGQDETPSTGDKSLEAASQFSDSKSADQTQKKKKKKRKQKTEEDQVQEEAVKEQQDDDAALNSNSAKSGDGGPKPRFIVFIGNLPFTATKTTVYKHFSSLQPVDVRLLTQRDGSNKSKGIAFVEFAGFDHMRTCLEKFHHSMFNDGVSPARKINVELTAGGGGKKSDSRREKIKQKNTKLNEERARRIQAEDEAKKEKQSAKEAEAPGMTEQRDSVHPSRRGRVPHHKR